MFDILLNMIQGGSISQGAGGLHLFDLFSEARMGREGAKKTVSFGVDEEEEVTHVQGFGQDYDLHWSVDSPEKQVEIVNLDGNNNYKISMSSGSSVSEVLVTVNGEPGNLELIINGNISPENQTRLAQNLQNLDQYVRSNKTPRVSVVHSSATAVLPEPHGHDDDHGDGDHGM